MTERADNEFLIYQTWTQHNGQITNISTQTPSYGSIRLHSAKSLRRCAKIELAYYAGLKIRKTGLVTTEATASFTAVQFQLPQNKLNKSIF